MGEQHHDVTEAEAVLQALWDLGPSTIRQLVERVYRQTGASADGTVQKLLERLEAKGLSAATAANPCISSGRRWTATS